MRLAAPRLLIMLVALAVGLLLRFMAASKETPLSVSGTAEDPSSALSLAVEQGASVVDENAPAAAEEPIRRVTIRLKEGDTLHDLLAAYGVRPQEISEIIASSKKIYNLTRLRAGKSITLTLDQQSKSIEHLEYSYDDAHLLTVRRDGGGYRASQEQIKYHVAMRSVRGTITSSLFDDAVRAGCPPQLVMQFADLFAWDVDFFTSVRENDEFKLVFEEIIRDGTTVKYGKILAAEFINQGRKYRAFSFGGGGEAAGYYDDRGQSVAREFLKTPLRYSRISSGFTKRRYHPILRMYRPHLGVDYAAPAGTPVEATANGKIIFMGWKGGYGKCVKIRHNNNFTSFYGHLSRFGSGLKQGMKVRQGQVIGYVGSTGLSTGPHLDYRLQKSEEFVNPVHFTSIQKETISARLRPQFEKARREFLIRLEQLDEDVVLAAASFL
jgi:murein DD-endopeptidase MepM/ murein hydrolase activator NlpD